MTLTYIQNKVHIYNHRAKNHDKYNNYQRLLVAKLRDYKRSCDYEYTARLFRNIYIN